MYKYLLLALLIGVQGIRALLLSSRKKDSRYLLVSFFLISVPLDLSYPLVVAKYSTIAGTLGTVLNLTVPLLMWLFFFPLSKSTTRLRFGFWFWAFVCVIIGSLINPFNHAKFATYVYIFFIASHLLVFSLLIKTLTKQQLFKGVFDGISILCIINFVLAVCFPLLQIKFVTTIFHPEAVEWSTRVGTREGAVGVFTHPGNLSLFTSIFTPLFLACYLKAYKKQLCLLILIFNTITVILTYSRTSYLCYTFDVFAVYFIIRNAHKNFLSVGNIFKFVLPVAGSLIWLVYFSPLSDAFLKSDTDEMLDARLIHWYMALDIFNTSPIIGVGLNTHLDFVAHNNALFTSDVSINQFFYENPIHNIHLIVLSETGIIGLSLWVCFVFYNISRSKAEIAKGQNEILSATFAGAIMAVVIYGSTGWAPFSSGIFPYFLFLSFFAIQYRRAQYN